MTLTQVGLHEGLLGPEPVVEGALGHARLRGDRLHPVGVAGERRDAGRVLQQAGERVECSAEACCGLTWISTGQLGTARRLLARAAEALDDGTFGMARETGERLNAAIAASSPPVSQTRIPITTPKPNRLANSHGSCQWVSRLPASSYWVWRWLLPDARLPGTQPHQQQRQQRPRHLLVPGPSRSEWLVQPTSGGVAIVFDR